MPNATAAPTPLVADESTETIPLIPEEILRQHHCLEADASRFTAAARLLQSLWRQDQNLPVGRHRSPSGEIREIGSRLTMSAGRAGANFLDPAIASLVRRELVYREIGALIDADRLFRNLLSSMPLVFNLFGPLKGDLELATCVMRLILPGFTGTVTKILFEHSPGRGNPAFSADYTAADALVRYRTEDGRRGFVFVEQKYTETLQESTQPTRPHLDRLSEQSGLFKDPHAASLRSSPCQQLWREHLLAASMIQRGNYDEGHFVVIAPRLNWHAQNGIAAYARHLKKPEPGQPVFAGIFLERFIEAIGTAGKHDYAQRLHQRYADFARIDQLIDAYLDAEDQAGIELLTIPEVSSSGSEAKAMAAA
ncbi:hypothetical protein HNR26_004612 [Rhizobium rosettiformans]|uniref:PD-(D/E)XK nuclease-like domain-containing protein n=2 Tax=Rhizobium rosettiformans TaxID=1368430 RepID=A0A4S8PK14_9HYPH|nr:hypothetical protein [Rhizobium rosettiformans]MBB5278511.1 hypothetical protein [Rhizobium rosettiformans]THV31073.1 hypothetical protein FAA86_22455 [Rhizobium rosettiformans W3]